MVMIVGCGKCEAAALTEQYIDDIGDVSIDSNGSYNAETLMKTQFLEVSQ